MAVLAPMPSASESTAAAVNPVAHAAQGVADILQGGFEPHQDVAVARRFAQRGAVAEQQSGFAAGVFWAHAAGDEIVGALLDVEAKLSSSARSSGFGSNVRSSLRIHDIAPPQA